MNKILFYISRYLLGIIFLGAGINGFFVIFGFDPFIETSPEAMALFEFHYLLVFEKALEVICGILLLFNRYVPLALAILSPIIANIFLLHLFLDHSLLLLALVLVVAYLYMAYKYRENFRKIFEKNPSI
ncbi:DoxX family membrane protein [Oceanobacillus halophilus]|uniref:DoxX family membrane protein n=1 Tax=Oceanobacillus halophilus TaxID=930130 RepID=A0A495A0C4_9BACI|nr:hypothetical protein [Oceanobacillus halophilus]RKQ32715.1 hypothetical protein D8M06_12360 [Oceanobacillus halophilus]